MDNSFNSTWSTPIRTQNTLNYRYNHQSAFKQYSPFTSGSLFSSPLSIDSSYQTVTVNTSIWSPQYQVINSPSSFRPIIKAKKDLSKLDTWASPVLSPKATESLLDDSEIHSDTSASPPKTSSLTSHQRLPKRSDNFDFTHMIYQATLKEVKTGKKQMCSFCRNNNEPELIYTCHQLKDSLGRVTCPILKAHVCPICGASGELSHTLKYCPILQKKSKLNKILRHAN